MIEADKVKPNRLQDILFTGTGKKGDNYKFGPVVANSIKIWKTVERRIGGPFKFCNSTPLWHNFNFVCGNRPFVQPSWSSLGVNTCGDIYDNQGLCSFQTLRTNFVYQHPHILSFLNSVGIFYFLSSYAGLDCTICWSAICFLNIFTFTFMHLADAFIQSDLHCIQVTVLHFISSCFPWESNPRSWRC